MAVDVYDGGSLVDYTEFVPIRLQYNPEATMNLATAAATVLDNELFTVGAGFALVGSVVTSDGTPLTAADAAVVKFESEDGGYVEIVPDDAGAFEVTLPEGAWLATASADGVVEDSIGFDLFVGGDQPELLFVLIGEFGYTPAQHEFIEGETELFGNAGEVVGGVPPYEYMTTGGTAAFWLDVDPTTGDLIFADGATEAPGQGHYDLNVDIYDSGEGMVSGSFGVQVNAAPDSDFDVWFDGYGFTEGSLSVTGVVGEVFGGVEPYAYEVTGGTAAAWLDVEPTTGELMLAAGTSFVPAPGLYQLDVEVTDSATLPDSQPGFIAGQVHVDVMSPEITTAGFDTGATAVRQSDLDAGVVTVILSVAGDAGALADVTLFAGEHVISQTPDAAGNAAFLYLSTDDILDPTTQEPIYGRYAVAYTPNGGPERSTSQYVNIAQTPEQAWQGGLWLGDGEHSYANVDIGAAINAYDEYDPIEDIVAPPSPTPDEDTSITLWRDGLALSRDIVAMGVDLPLVWSFDVNVPEFDLWLDWSFEDAAGYYDVATLENVDSGETWNLHESDSVSVPVGAHSFTLVLERSPFQKRGLELPPRWTLLSLPGPTLEGTPAMLLELLDVDTVFGWAPGLGYEEPLFDDPLEHITRGYFVHRSSELDYEGIEVNVDLDDPTAVEADIAVDTGWNIVGVVEGGIEAGALSPNANTVFRWEAHSDPQKYSEPLSSGGLLNPFEGVWVFNPGEAYTASVTQLRFRSGPGIGDGAPAQAQPDWMVSLRMDTADGQERRLELGSGAFAEAGYDAMDIVTPPPPAMRDYAEFFTRSQGEMLAGEELADDFYGLSLAYSKTYDYGTMAWLQLLYNWGGGIWDWDTRRVDGILNSPAAVESLEYHIDLLKYQPAGAANYDLDAVNNAVAQGLVAMASNWIAIVPQLFDPSVSKVADKLMVVVPPGHDGKRVYNLGGQPFVVGSKTKHVKEVLAYIKWWFQDEQQLRFARGGGLPATTTLIGSDEFKALSPWTRAFSDAVPLQQDVWKHPEFFQLLTAQQEEFHKAVTGSQTAKEALDNAARRQETILEDWGEYD